jgi:mannosyltransferase
VSVDVHADPATSARFGGRALATVRELARRDAWAAALAAAVSLALGLYQLGQPSLWIDESYTWRATTEWSYVDLVHEHHWIYYTLMKPWSSLVGTSEVALRFPSVLAAAAACAVLVPFGNRLMGRPVGSIAGVALALSPFVVQWSQQARSYTIVMLLAIVSTTCFLHMRTRDSTRSWLLYMGALVLFVLIQPLSAGLMAAAHLVAGPSRKARAKLITAGVAAVLLTSLFLLGVAARDSKNGTLVWNVDPTFGSVSHALVELSGALGIGLALSVVALAVVKRERLLLASWAFTPLVISVIATPAADIFVDRYLLVSTPAFALLVGAAVHSVRGWWRAGAVAAFAAGTVLGLAVWYGPDGSRNWRGEDWNAATRYAMQHGGARVHPDWTASAYEYYGGVQRENGLYVLWTENEEDLAGDWPLDVGFGERLRIQHRP